MKIKTALLSTWPVGIGASIWLTQYLITKGYGPVAVFLGVYIGLALAIWAVEHLAPHSRRWKTFDNQWVNDIFHTIFSKTLTEGAVKSLTMAFTLYWYSSHVVPLHALSALPVWLQFLVALLVADLFHYWFHRIAHTRWGFWCFHALHHSATRLWVGNTSRGHFVDDVLFNIAGTVPLLLLRFEPATIFWVLIINAYVGAFTHCNIKMRLGLFSYLFNTPELHRWHHSKRKKEGNTNFGQLFTVWDIVFGTYHNPQNKRPPENVGITSPMPEGIAAQLVWPFKSLRKDGKNILTYIG